MDWFKGFFNRKPPIFWIFNGKNYGFRLRFSRENQSNEKNNNHHLPSDSSEVQSAERLRHRPPTPVGLVGPAIGMIQMIQTCVLYTSLMDVMDVKLT